MKVFLLIFIHNLYTINRLKHKKRESEKKIIKKMTKNRKKFFTVHSIIHCKYNAPEEYFRVSDIYNSYVKVKLYELDLWTKLQKTHKNYLVF